METGANLGVKKRKPFVSPSLSKGNIFQRSVALCSKIDQHGARFPPVSHMGHYASLAQKSMDCFVLVTAPFHFTSGGACAPPKHSATWCGRGHSQIPMLLVGLLTQLG
ncbi:hypothetical protein CY35_02G053900 [Sphagnum magellanicum]|nr:hypothetical protein CY35_02G053900 [Sphagnum magellanicum]